jgi:hypothetical protein
VLKRLAVSARQFRHREDDRTPKPSSAAKFEAFLSKLQNVWHCNSKADAT